MKKYLWLMLFCCAVQAEETPAESPQAPPAPPGSEILLFEINEKDGWVTLGEGVNISQSKGYDSQPRFSTDGQFIYYTHFQDGQMDVFEYDLVKKSNQAYLKTAESEYSPTPKLNDDGLSVVQVNADGDQFLVQLNSQLPKAQQAQRYSDLKQVGYFNWTQGGYLWSFVLNESSGGDLYRQNPQKEAVKITEHVGRSFITDKTSTYLYFVNKNTQPWSINRVSAEQQKPEPVMDLPVGVEDFTLDSKGRFWAGRDNTLFMSDDQQRWFIVHEFSNPDFHQISRLTTNPNADKIAVVFAEKPQTE